MKQTVPFAGTFDVDLQQTQAGSRGQWTPLVGGELGESGQIYHIQRGLWGLSGYVLDVWGYVQCSDYGTILGTVVVRGLPFPAWKDWPMIYGGDFALESNLHQPYPGQAPKIAIKLLVGASTDYGKCFVQEASYANQRFLVGADLNPMTQLVFNDRYLID